MKQLMTLFLVFGIISCDPAETAEGAFADDFEALVEVPATGATLEEPTTTVDRKLIKTAQLQFETKDLKSTANSLRVLSNQFAGFVSDEKLEEIGDRHWNKLQIKVPSENFDSLLESISKQVGKFDRLEVSSQDVTEEYMDLQARIATKKKVEQRYLEILKEAKTIKEILQVEAEAAAIREQIERAEGRIQYLSTRSSMSALHISFYQVVPHTVFEKQPGFLTHLAEGLQNGLGLLKGIAIGIANIWPLILLFGSVIFIYRKKLRKSPVTTA